MVYLAAFAVVGTILLILGKAAVLMNSFEPEADTVTAPAKVVTDAGTSGGGAVSFGGSVTPPPPGGSRAVAVTTAAQLTAALSDARAGDVITLANGTYSGRFVGTASGTASAPITIKGSRSAIIDGGILTSGYTFALGTKNSANTVSYWRVEGFTVTGGQKGMMLDNIQHSIIDGVLVQNTGQEGLHIRNNSSDNIVQNSTVTKTGQEQQAYGEGIYIGTAVSNWSTFSQGQPDHSNRNQILNNTISYTGAENIDIKEGTHAGIMRGNKLDGHGMCWEAGEDCNYGDSLLDMKGEGWTVESNAGSYVHPVWEKGGQTNDGFQVHVISNTGSEGSGTSNIFSKNTISDVGGYGFNIQSSAASTTTVKCDNTVTAAGSGFGNVTCKP